MLSAMNRKPALHSLLRPCVISGLIAFGSVLGLVSCASEPEKKPVGPTTDTSPLSWNSQVPGQGMGQFGMMPQNQYRR
jgi:hypothetical protein